MIKLRHVSVNYPSATPLKDVNVALEAGTAAIMGPSGSGKSTMLRLIAGMQAPTKGEVIIAGSPVALASWRSSSDPRVSMIHQDYRLVPFLTVEENMLLAAELRGLRRAPEDVLSALDTVGLAAAMRERLPATMSGGEQQRVAIARTLITGARVIVADEPTGALDVENTLRVTETLSDLGKTKDLAIIVATHDPSVAERMDRRLLLSGGMLEERA